MNLHVKIKRNSAQTFRNINVFIFLDLIKLYNHPKLDPDAGPRQLLNKVQFNIRFYLCRRGNGNFLLVEKDHFALDYYTKTSKAFVKKVKDELMKNYRDSDVGVTTGFMPQIIGADGRPHKLCPVRSYENYINHLNNKCNMLWQHPLKRFPEDPASCYYMV